MINELSEDHTNDEIDQRNAIYWRNPVATGPDEIEEPIIDLSDPVVYDEYVAEMNEKAAEVREATNEAIVWASDNAIAETIENTAQAAAESLPAKAEAIEEA